MIKVSVIMSSYLSYYPNCASNREKKFIRAVNSFKKQTYKNIELIIVSDGCKLTIELYNKYFSNDSNITLIKIDKQPLYSGEMRNVALKVAKGEIITYLDSDDVIGQNHIQKIVDQFDLDKFDLVYYNDYLVMDSTFKKLQKRIVELRWSSIGTSSISHKNIKNIEWTTGYGQDFNFLFKLVSAGLRFKKLEISSEYLVCHYSNSDY